MHQCHQDQHGHGRGQKVQELCYEEEHAQA
jgi:hypothetical protein